MPFRGRKKKKKVELDTLVFIGKQLKTNVGGKKGDKRPSCLLASLFKKKKNVFNIYINEIFICHYETGSEGCCV